MNVIMVIILVASSAFSIMDGHGDCETARDIAILLDGSTSMNTSGFAAIKRYAVDMIGNMDVRSDKTRVCAVVFTLNATVVFDLKTYNSTNGVQNATSQILYEGGASAIKEGMNLAENELYNEQGGARLGVPKFLIVFSDGDFVQFSPYPMINSTNILAIGPGSLPPYSEDALTKLVKDPNKDRFTTGMQPQDVVNRIDGLAKQSCQKLPIQAI